MLPAAQTWSLTAIAMATGAALLWVWKRFSDQPGIALAKRQSRAQIYAMRLYSDDLSAVFRAQRRLLYWTGRRLAGALHPAAISVVPFLVLMLLLEPFYGQRPLAAGERVVITARLDGEQAADAAIEGRGLVVETPGVRFADGRRVSWRIRGSGGAGSAVLSAGSTNRAQNIKCGGITSSPLAVGCSAYPVEVLGVQVRWEVFFLLVNLATMLALHRWWRVTL